MSRFFYRWKPAQQGTQILIFGVCTIGMDAVLFFYPLLALQIRLQFIRHIINIYLAKFLTTTLYNQQISLKCKLERVHLKLLQSIQIKAITIEYLHFIQPDRRTKRRGHVYQRKRARIFWDRR